MMNYSSTQTELEAIIKNLSSTNAKMEALDELADLLTRVRTTSFLGVLDKLFHGFRSCLTVDSSNTEIFLKTNTLLLDIVPDISHND